MTPPLTNAVVVLTETDGNAFAILAHVRRAILQSDRPDLAAEFLNEAKAGDYAQLLQTCFKYVTVE